ncbi:MAG: hypothetical protein ACXAC7_16215 [Candidatus Hodarchaeales archaeon]|jgi:predicted transcriptional regulator
MSIRDKKNYYSELVIKMEKQLKIFSHESCQAIYTQLLIFGKMTHTQILEKLNFSRGTIFNALLLLQEADFVGKGVDTAIKDKRKNSYYYAKDDDIEFDVGKEFLDYLITHNKVEIYKKYLRNSYSLNSGLIKYAISIQNEKTIKNFENRDIKHLKKGKKSPNIHYYDVGSLKNHDKLIESIKKCIQEFEDELDKRIDPTKPLEHPVVFSLLFVPLD